jgi:hypothetical protein
MKDIDCARMALGMKGMKEFPEKNKNDQIYIK